MRAGWQVNQLNEWLNEVETVKVGPHGDVARKIVFKTANEVLQHWSLIGVVKVEVAPKRLSMSQLQAGNSRILNLIIAGRVAVLNVFGSAVAGDQLYFIVKRHKKSMDGESRWCILPYVSSNGARPGARVHRVDSRPREARCGQRRQSKKKTKCNVDASRRARRAQESVVRCREANV